MAANYYEERGGKLHREWVSLSEKKPYAWILIVAGGGLFVSNMLGTEGPPNNTLGAITIGAFGVGCVWLWNIRKEMDAIIRRSVENEKLRKQSEALAETEKDDR